MKDEEMAEEYYYKTYPVTLNVGEEERKKEVTDIFLAGLKAGRPQWHDLRENPNDLPGNERYVWTDRGPNYYDSDCRCWRNDFGRTYGIISWCEPKFEE